MSSVPAQTPIAPEITSHPPEEIVGIRGQALVSPIRQPALAVFANGSLPMTAQWFKDDLLVNTTIAAAGFSFFTIDQLQTSDAGVYYAILRNSGGTATSPRSRVRVVEPIEIIAQPQSTSRTAGATVSLSVEVTGEGPISYQWHLESGNPIPGATSSRIDYTVPAGGPAGVTFFATITNPYQTVTSNRATVRISRPPVFTQHPPEVLWLRNSFLTSLAIDFEDNFGASVEWRKDGVLIAGATSKSYLLISTNTAEVAEYTVTLTNLVGLVTSRTCRVISAPRLQIVREPERRSAPAGNSAALTVGVIGGHEPYSYQWYTDTAAGAHSKIVDAVSSALELKDLRPEHARRYCVEVQDKSGDSVSSESVDLTIVGSATSAVVLPRFLVEPEASFPGPIVGSFWTFATVAPGATHYMWMRNGVEIPGATMSVLALQPLGLEHAGAYTVIAQNAAGSITSRAVRLEVSPMTRLWSGSQARRQTVIAGAHVTLTAQIYGSNPIRRQWRRNGNDLAGKTDGELTIFNATAADAGSYTVFASADVGTVTTEPQELVVMPPAGCVANVSVRSVTEPTAGVLVAGFTVAGPAEKALLIRGIGPALADFGVTGSLRDPDLTVATQGGLPLASGAQYAGEPALAEAFGRVGAFPLRVPSADTALLFRTVSGSFTARVGSRSNATGVALAEIYDLDRNATTTRITNVSVRSVVQEVTGPLIVGFSIAGDGPVNVVIRAIGPTLTQFGVSGVLMEPVLALHSIRNGQERILARNSGWGGSAILADAFSKEGAFALSPLSQDAAILATLDPGSYTVVISGRDYGTGMALVEVYAFQ